jgi:FkbM family methyltransferase
LLQPERSTENGAAPAKVGGFRPIDMALMAYARAFEHPGKIRVLKWLIRGVAAGRIEIRQAGGSVLAIDPNDYIGWQIFKTGAYEPASLALARRIMAAEPGLFVDVGAHVGWYALAIAPMAGATVIAVEPDSGNCAALRANIARNRLRNIAVCHAAVAAEAGLLALARRAPMNSGTAAVCAANPSASGQYWVAAVRLQDLLNRLVSPPARPVLLKIDIEGFEPQALAGLDFDGAFRPKNILLEYEPAFAPRGWENREELMAFFAGRGYALHDVSGRPITRDAVLPDANVWARDAREAGLRP